MSHRKKLLTYCFSIGGALLLLSFYLALFVPKGMGAWLLVLLHLGIFRLLLSLLTLLALIGFGLIFTRALLAPLESSVLVIKDVGGDISIAASALESHIEMTALRVPEVKKAKAELTLSGSKVTKIDLRLTLWLEDYAKAKELSETLTDSLSESIRAFSGRGPDSIRFRFPELEQRASKEA